MDNSQGGCSEVTQIYLLIRCLVRLQKRFCDGQSGVVRGSDCEPGLSGVPDTSRTPGDIDS